MDLAMGDADVGPRPEPDHTFFSSFFLPTWPEYETLDLNYMDGRCFGTKRQT